MVNAFWLTINGRVDCEKVFSFCCEPKQDIPMIPFGKDARETLMNIIDARLEFINESNLVEDAVIGERQCTKACLECANFVKGKWQPSGRIYYVNLSAYPSPCQCRCFYCGLHEMDQSINPDVKEKYELLFDTLEYARRCGVISPDAIWQVSCGEITIHPYKERIIKLVEGQKAAFLTNGFKYDESIANTLKSNPRSAINISIDAGTPSTWHKVKGVNNFETVMMYLTKYYLASDHPGQIQLKYIVLPEVNDGDADYISLMEIMKILKVSHLYISSDTRNKYNMSEKETNKLAVAAARLVALCRRNNFTVELNNSYTPSERNLIIALAGKMLGAERK